MWSMTGGCQLDFLEMLFSFLKSVQNLLVPSFLTQLKAFSCTIPVTLLLVVMVVAAVALALM